MTAKNLISATLLLFVAASVGALLLKDPGTAARPVPAAATAGTAAGGSPPATGAERELHQAAPGKVLAYYLHAKNRCRTCLAIEAYTLETLAQRFAEPMRQGLLEWQALDVEIPANAHFIEDFQLVTSAVVLQAVTDGRPQHWKRLDRIWELVKDKGAFQRYIGDETAAFCAEAGQ